MPVALPDFGETTAELPDFGGDAALPDFTPLPALTPEQLAAFKASPIERVSPWGDVAGQHDDEFLRTVVNDPVGAVKALPEIAMGIATAPGKLAYYSAADAVSKVTGQREYGGNLAALQEAPGTMPVDKFLAEVAKTNPNLATAGNVGQSLAAMAPLAAVGMLPATAAKLLTAGFSVSMVVSAPALFNEYAEERYKPADEQDAGKLARLRSDIIQTFAFAPLAGAGAVPEAKATRLAKELAKQLDAADFTPPERVQSPEPRVQSQTESRPPWEDFGAVTEKPSRALPLPAGEGRGEGEPSAIPERPDVPTPLETKTPGGEAEGFSETASEPITGNSMFQSAPGQPGEGATPPEPPAVVKPQSASPNPQSAIPVTARHLQEARDILTSQERPPDILDELSGGVTTGKIKFSGEQADLVANTQEALADALYEKPYRLLTKPQRAKVDKATGMSTTEGSPADQVLTGLRDNPRYTDWTPDDLANAMSNAAVGRASAAEVSPAKLESLAQELAAAERVSEKVSEPVSEIPPAEAPTHPLTDSPTHDADPWSMPEVTGNEAELVGLGGAIPAEYARSQGTSTGIKNATVDRERALRGLPPAVEPARRSFGEVWDQAMAAIDHAPDTQDLLIKELRDKPRALTDVEDALLLQRQIDLQNEYGKATRDLAQAYDDAGQFPERLAAVEQGKLRVAAYSDQLLDLYNINKAVGTETGRGLAARKMMAYEDFSLAKMELEKRAANGGAPITDAERVEITRLQKVIEEMTVKATEREAAVAAEHAKYQAADELNRIVDTVTKTPGYDRNVQSIASRLSTIIQTRGAAARERFKAKMARTSAGVDPTILGDLVEIAAADIDSGIRNLAHWSKKMLAEYGPDVAHLLNSAWNKANALIDGMVDRAASGKTAEAVKRNVKKEDVEGTRENIIRKLNQERVARTKLNELGPLVRKLVENFVRSGMRELDPITDAIHAILQENFDPALTRRQTTEIMGGYGDFRELSKDQVAMAVRDLRGQAQLTAKLLAVEAKEPLLKSGPERAPVTDKQRRLQQLLNEAKRRFGVVTTDPARQLKSSLDAIKTRLTNQIKDLDFQLATKTKIVKDRSKTPYDAEATLLQARRAELQRQFVEMFPKQPLTDTQRAAIAQRTLERSIADYETRIAAGDVNSRRARPAITTPELEALRTRRDAIRAEWEALRALDPQFQLTREAQALAQYKSRLLTQEASYRDRLARGDFTPRTRRQIKPDAEALDYRARAELAKREFQRGLITDRLKNRSLGRKIFDTAKEALNLPRNLLSSWDLSAVLRQGGFIVMGHPVRAFQSLGPMFRALASERHAAMIEQEILRRPNSLTGKYKQGKLYLAPHEALHLSAMEEQIMSRLGERIPGLRASNRAYITFLNKLRADSFDAMLESLESRGTPLNAPELQAIGNYINVATGRGNLYQAAMASETLATVFFSPRLMASRFQLLAGQPLFHGSARTRVLVATEYGRFLAGMAVVYTLGTMAGATIELDPRSSDFGKLRFGNTRVDPLAGLSQVSALVTRLTTGATKTASGVIKPIRGADVPYGSTTSWDVITRFLRSKLSPVVGATVDVLQGKNVVGEPVTPGAVASRLAVPLSFQDIYQAMQDQGVPRGTALGILSLFGYGLQTYEGASDAKTVSGQMLQGVHNITPEQRKALRTLLEQRLNANSTANPASSNALRNLAEHLRARQEFSRTNAPVR